MKQYVTRWNFRDAFLGSDTYKNNFSYDGLTALFNYLEELEEDTGEEMEFDVVSICCTYSEYENLEEFQECYSDEYESIEKLEEYTTVIMIDDESFIVEDF